MVNVWPYIVYHLSGLPLQRYFNDNCTQPLCQALVSPLRHWKVKTLHIHVHIHFCGFFHLGCKNRHMIGFKTRLAGSHMLNSITLAEPLKRVHIHPSRCTLTSQNRLWFLLLIIPIVCWFCMKLPKTHQVELFHHVALHSRRGGGGREDHNT